MSRVNRRLKIVRSLKWSPAVELLERRYLMVNEIEPNDTLATATDFASGQPLDGRVALVRDIDHFHTRLLQGDVLRVYELNFAVPFAEFGLPPRVDILGAVGQVLASSTDGRDVEVTAVEAGDYYVRVSSGSDFGVIAEAYSLLTRRTAFAGVVESEPNNATDTATLLTANSSFLGSLAQSDSVDIFTIDMGVNQTLMVNFAGPLEQRPAVSLRSPSGVLLDSANGGQGLAFTASTAGRYELHLTDNVAGGQTGSYVGNAQVVAAAMASASPGANFDSALELPLSLNQQYWVHELTDQAPVHLFAVDIDSLSRAEFALTMAGPAGISGYGRMIRAFDRLGNWVGESRDGYLTVERYLGSTPGKFFLQVTADSPQGLGVYGLRMVNHDDYSNQRDVPLHLIDFRRQRPSYNGFNFTADFGVPGAIPFVVGLNDSRFGPYEVDVTEQLPDWPISNYILSGYGDFANLNGGVGGGYYGNRRPNGQTANNDDQTTWTRIAYNGPLIHEFGHAAGLGHSRDISSVMSYVHTDNIIPVGSRFAFVNVDQRRPDTYLTNDRSRLDWMLASGSQVLEPADTNRPLDLAPFMVEMSLEVDPAPDSYVTGTRPTHLETGDFNGDGWQDVIVTHEGTRLSMYLNDGAGRLRAPMNYTVKAMGWWNEAVTVGDFNRDGRDDVAVIGREAELLTIMLANADGTLTTAATETIGRWPQVIRAVDVNGDSRIDLVAANANSQISIRLGRGDGTFQTTQSISAGWDPNHLVVADLNGDGLVDIASANYGDQAVAVMLASGSGSFNTVQQIPVGAVSRGLAAIDFDGDGDLDLVAGKHHERTVQFFANQGNGTFVASDTIQTTIFFENIRTADVNLDGRADLLLGGNNWRFEVMLGTEDGGFTRPIQFPTQAGAVNNLSTDLNRDGRPDLVTISFWQDQLIVYSGLQDSPRNNRVTVYGELTEATDIDEYQFAVLAGETYSFDIDAAEHQLPLDAQLTIVSASGVVLATNRSALDRESGLDSVDPYILSAFNQSQTVTIVVRSEAETAGAYRLKVTPRSSLPVDSPRVLAVVPDNGESIDSTRQISLLFDRQLDPASLTSSSVVVRGAQSGVRTGSIHYDPLDGFLIWTADAALPVDNYTVTLSSGATGVRDLVGNPLDGEFALSAVFPVISGDGIAGGNFVSRFQVTQIDTRPAFQYYASYHDDPSNRGRIELRWNEELSFLSIEQANFILRSPGADGTWDTVDDRLHPLDAIYDKIWNLNWRSGILDVYTRGLLDTGIYRLEGRLEDVHGNGLDLSQQILIGASVSESLLSVDEQGSQPGLMGSYINQSLRNTAAQTDWRTTQTIAGTRVDSTVAFNLNSFGRRSEVGITGGTDGNWDNFSVQWDGWLNVPVNGMQFFTWSDDGSRMWIDRDGNGQFDPTDFFDNNWGRGQGPTAGSLTPSLNAGRYRIRMQYEEGDGGNRMMLQSLATGAPSRDRGTTASPMVVDMNFDPLSTTLDNPPNTIEVTFSSFLDLATLTPANFRVRYSADPTFFDSNDVYLSDADGQIAWDSRRLTATFAPAQSLQAGHYLVQLNGDVGGIANPVGRLLDGEFTTNYIQGNTNIRSQSGWVSGNGLSGGDFNAPFSIAAGVNLTLQTTTLNEGTETQATLVRNSNIAVPLVVQIAVDDANLLQVPASVTIPAGALQTTFRVQAINNQVAHGNRTTVLRATTTSLALQPIAVTVVDDERPTLQLNLQPQTISEVGGISSATISRNTPHDQPVSVTLQASDPTLVSFTTTVTIPAGEQSTSVQIVGVNNQLAFGTQMVQIQASAISFVGDAETLTITDDDLAQLALTLEANSIVEGNGRVTGRVTRNTPNAQPLIVALSSSDVSEARVPATVTIPAGASSVTFDVTSQDDTQADGNQLITITATAASHAVASQQLTVNDNDPAALFLQLLAGSIQEGGRAIGAQISRNTSTAAELSISITGGQGQLLLPDRVTFAAGQERVSFDITAIDDLLSSGNRTVSIVVSANGFVSSTAELTITDDEIPTLSISKSLDAISENGGTAQWTVSRNTPVAGALLVGLASSPLGLVELPGTLTIPAGAASATFNVAAINDEFANGDRVVTVTASRNGFQSASSTLSILDDDTPRLSVQLQTSQISEAGSGTIVTIARNTTPTLPLVIYLTADRTFANVPPSVTIPSGSLTTSFAVSAINNQLATGNQILSIVAMADSFASGSAQLTIVDDDQRALSLSTSQVASESAGSITARLTRNTRDDEAIEVQLTPSDTTALSVPSAITIPVGSSFIDIPVTIIDNSLAYGQRQVSLTAARAGYTSAVAQLTLLDDDTPSLTVAASASEIAENGGRTSLTISRNTPTAAALAVQLAATPSGRLTFPAIVTIPANADSITLDAVAVDDSLARGNRTIALTASSTGFQSASQQVQVIDDESPALVLSFTQNSMTESGSLLGTVSRNTSLERSLVVTLFSSNPAAVSLPSTVTIQAGQSSANFQVLAIDDALATGDQQATINATSAAHNPASAVLTLIDNDQPRLTLTLASSTVREGETVQISVRRNTPTTARLAFSLEATIDGVVVVPAALAIPLGSSEVTFALATVDDTVFRGTQAVVLSPQVTGVASDSVTLSVTDNDNPFPWSNPRNRYDVNDDTRVTPLDILLIINSLNADGPRRLPETMSNAGPPRYYDVSQDNSISPLDILLIINYLNRPADAEPDSRANAIDDLYGSEDWMEDTVFADIWYSALWQGEQERRSRLLAGRLRTR